MPQPTPRSPAPPLDLPLVGGGRFVLAEAAPQTFTLLVFYRGVHCPKCKEQLQELQDRLGALRDIGVDQVVAVSGDDQDRAERAKAEWQVPDVPVAYGLTEPQMRTWGLYVSKGVKEPEPDVFSEPALYLVDPAGLVYSAHVQSTPFARPHLDDLIASAGWVAKNDYPARGEA